MRTEVYPYQVDTTEECLSLIDPFKQHDFKRKNKFNINVGHEQYVVRVFHDKKTDKTYSIVNHSKETKVLEIDLSNFREIIKEIQEVAKKVYTHDYGEVWLNPWEMKIWVSGGDGGIVRYEGSPKKLAKIIEEEGFDFDFDEELGFANIAGIKEEIIEAECSPTSGNEDEADDYLYVALCRDITNYMEY
jgi:hypothetical protein